MISREFDTITMRRILLTRICSNWFSESSTEKEYEWWVEEDDWCWLGGFGGGGGGEEKSQGASASVQGQLSTCQVHKWKTRWNEMDWNETN